MNKTFKKSSQSGFTLIEIMVVVVILGLLGTMVIQAVGDRPDQAREVKVGNDVASLESALKLYKLDNFNYPTQAQGLAALSANPSASANWRGPYIERLPKDPWGNDYQYRYPSSHGLKLDVYSFGSDGAEGGIDDGADIGNWNIK